MHSILAESHRYLADLIEASQRCAWHLEATAARVPWPLTADSLEHRQMDLALFEPLAAMNERFAKLQDLLSTAMRHCCELSGERTDTFLRVLAACKKRGLCPPPKTGRRAAACATARPTTMVRTSRLQPPISTP